MATINGDIRLADNQGGRRAGAIRDGPYIRALLVAPGNVVQVRSVEGAILYEERALPQDFSIQSIAAARSSFSGKLVLILGGFTPDTGDSRTLIVTTDYALQAPP